MCQQTSSFKKRFFCRQIEARLDVGSVRGSNPLNIWSISRRYCLGAKGEREVCADADFQ
jgi:hypothetical protein